MNTQNRTAAVVVTYNRKELLRQSLTAILNQEEFGADIIIIDNASSDGTADMVSKEFNLPQIIYRNTGTNLGGAGGFQYGVREAMNAPKGYAYDYVWMMDDDTIPHDDCLKELMEADRKLNGNWGWLSSVAYWTDGSVCRMNIQKKNIFRHIGSQEYKKKMVPIKMCSFVSLLVRADAIHKVGFPIGEYFIWTDDYEYTGRISGKYPCYLVTGSKVIHAMKTHIRVDFARDDISRMDRYHYIYRNDVHCYRQYGIMGWLYIILKDIYTLLNIMKNSREGKLEKMKTVFSGFREGLRFRPKIETCAEKEPGGGIGRSVLIRCTDDFVFFGEAAA